MIRFHEVSRDVEMLRELKHIFQTKVLLSQYHSLVSSYIIYGCMIWTSDFYTNYKRVQVEQNKTVRIIGKYDQGTNSTLSIFKKFNLLNVGQIRDKKKDISVSQCWNKLGPEVFRSYFKHNSIYHQYYTRKWKWPD